ncbi:hypothetical protein P154DRAFT_556584 [Amniculicola lignicola CBS 123094]|uniref:HTH psq-type domain-containing protein n=1 Tax=Amniculicola lignicola CBS 123094 TaxID=1392246 RepID=A0A6A5W1Z8_9PLEO|nr:hypothetical protein P154DRAFT_556584 [Amniculicola lignicola CBS 123094]
MAGDPAALESLKSLKPGESLNYTKTAKEYGVDRSLLSKRHRGKIGTHAEGVDKSRLLNTTQEIELVQYIDKLCVDRFIARYKIKLVSHWTAGIDTTRHRADSAFKYSLYFKLIGEKISRYNIEPHNMYNIDEKGRLKRIFSRVLYEDGKQRSTIQDGSREWITLLACICADGSYLEPALIYQSASGLIQDSWLQALDHETHQVRISLSPSSWTNNDIGLAWLK